MRQISNKKSNNVPQDIRKTIIRQTRRGRWKEIIKIRAEINKMKIKRIIQRVDETQNWQILSQTNQEKES
jgi:uncharacterized membrane protein